MKVTNILETEDAVRVEYDDGFIVSCIPDDSGDERVEWAIKTEDLSETLFTVVATRAALITTINIWRKGFKAGEVEGRMNLGRDLRQLIGAMP